MLVCDGVYMHTHLCKGQGPTPSSGITGVCHHIWLFHRGLGDCTLVLTFLSELSLHPYLSFNQLEPSEKSFPKHSL